MHIFFSLSPSEVSLLSVSLLPSPLSLNKFFLLCLYRLTSRLGFFPLSLNLSSSPITQTWLYLKTLTPDFRCTYFSTGTWYSENTWFSENTPILDVHILVVRLGLFQFQILIFNILDFSEFSEKFLDNFGKSPQFGVDRNW